MRLAVAKRIFKRSLHCNTDVIRGFDGAHVQGIDNAVPRARKALIRFSVKLRAERNGAVKQLAPSGNICFQLVAVIKPVQRGSRELLCLIVKVQISGGPGALRPSGNRLGWASR